MEKIAADAEQRLPLPPGQLPTQELRRYKDFLKVESHRLKMLHRAGGGGRAICQARAGILDLLLQFLFQAVLESIPPTNAAKPALALVAIGGYGRKELNPHSDIDLMLLHDGNLVALDKANPYFAAVTDSFICILWDIGLKVGHSVRSIHDCVKVANSNMQSKTSLIEARLIAGNKSLFEQMQSSVLAKCVGGFEDEYIQARIADQEARRAKFGNSALMQEPNVKNGCGGLRDYQNLFWMAYFKYRVRTLDDLQQRELINEGELKKLDGAYDFLLRVRTELQYEMKRPVDVLTKAIQPTLAHNLGYLDRSPRKRLERFMRDVYTHMRNIYLITRTVEQRLALLPEGERPRSWRNLFRRPRASAAPQLVDGFKISKDEIYAASNRVFRDQPRRMMRVFLYAQQRGLKFHPDLAQLIRQQLNLVDRSFLRDPHAHETFLEILNQRGNVAPILHAMHDVGFLGKFLPEFGRLTCLVQHEFYHQYTADEHTLVCIEKLDQVWGATEQPFKAYAPIFQSLERPFILYLALLLHDAGKAYRTGDHAEIGRQLALKVAKRLGLDGATSHVLCLLIEHHLLMAQISQRRDLEDQSVIRHFAAQIQTPENLSMLTLHTLADSLGTSSQLWNGFKDSLLWTLHAKAMQTLSGATTFIRAEKLHRDLLVEEVRRLLPASFCQDEVLAHFEHLPLRYFQIHNARQITSHLTMAHRFMHLQVAEEDRALEPVVNWHDERDRAYTAVSVCTWDRAGLFSKIAGSFTAAGLNILSAQIHTRADGIILDDFFVTDAKTGLIANRAEKEKFEHYLGLVLAGGAIDLPALIAKARAPGPVHKVSEADRLPTRISFDNEISQDYTVVEIETEDRVGLLYALSQALSEADIDICLAKICTEKGAAIDAFYVHHANGGKILADEDQHLIQNRLRAAIHRLE